MLEADLDGGVLGARYGLGVDPGVVSLIAALRRSEGRRCRSRSTAGRPAPGLWLVPGPESGEQARSVWAGTAAVVAERLAGDDRVWLVDAGRLHGGSVTLPLVQRSRLTVVVCRAGPEDLVQVPARVADAGGALPRRSGCWWSARRPYSAGELAEFFGTPAVWRVGGADDLAGDGRRGAVAGPGPPLVGVATALDVAAQIAAQRSRRRSGSRAPSANGDRSAERRCRR